MSRVREIRLTKGIEVEDLMTLLDLKTKSAYYKKENGSNRFSLEEAKKISERFGMNIEELFFESKVSILDTESAHKEAS